MITIHGNISIPQFATVTRLMGSILNGENHKKIILINKSLLYIFSELNITFPTMVHRRSWPQRLSGVTWCGLTWVTRELNWVTRGYTEGYQGLHRGLPGVRHFQIDIPQRHLNYTPSLNIIIIVLSLLFLTNKSYLYSKKIPLSRTF